MSGKIVGAIGVVLAVLAVIGPGVALEMLSVWIALILAGISGFLKNTILPIVTLIISVIAVMKFVSLVSPSPVVDPMGNLRHIAIFGTVYLFAIAGIIASILRNCRRRADRRILPCKNWFTNV